MKFSNFFKPKAPETTHSTRARDIFLRAQSLQKSGEFEAAIDLYDGLLAGNGSDPEVQYKRANALYSLGRWEPALSGYDRAIALNPVFSSAFCNRGAVLERLKRWDEALASYDRAIALNGADVLALYNRGSVLKELKRFDEALASYEQAIDRKPDYAEAYINRGHVLHELRRDEESVASYDKAIECNPSYVEAFHGRGHALLELRRHEAAIASYDQALALNADQKYLLGLRRHVQMQICEWDGLAADVGRLAAGLVSLKPVATPFVMLSLDDSISLHRLAAEIWVREECPPNDALGVPLNRPTGDKIRVGYFSADFRIHPVSVLAAELFETHDRSKFDVIAFAIGRETNDSMRARLEKTFDSFYDVRDRSDIDIASFARKIGLDIAVDLGGFTEHSRTQIFALRAAPVQVSFLGYPGTMAAGYVDYLIGDATVVSPEFRSLCSEKIVEMPDCFMPSDSTRAVMDSVPPRERLGLPPTGFVYCCFNSNYKITPKVFDSWMRILGRVAGSVLWLAQSNAAAARNLRHEAARRGIDPVRLIFADRLPSAADHLARHRAADLFLDTSPYNAHATANDALWAGLPVLTCPSRGFAGRVAASLLTALDLPDLIATTEAEYENMAVNFATDRAALEGVRRKLARNREIAPLFKTERFTRSLESVYGQMHARQRSGLPPGPIVAARGTYEDQGNN